MSSSLALLLVLVNISLHLHSLDYPLCLSLWWPCPPIWSPTEDSVECEMGATLFPKGAAGTFPDLIKPFTEPETPYPFPSPQSPLHFVSVTVWVLLWESHCQLVSMCRSIIIDAMLWAGSWSIFASSNDRLKRTTHVAEATSAVLVWTSTINLIFMELYAFLSVRFIFCVCYTSLRIFKPSHYLQGHFMLVTCMCSCLPFHH